MSNLIERINIALISYTNKTDSMHVPPKEIDVDVVLSDCRDELLDLKQQLAEAHASRASWVEYSQKIESGEFVLVPREPTLQMLKLADKHMMDCSATPESAYKVMIKASQQPTNLIDSFIADGGFDKAMGGKNSE